MAHWTQFGCHGGAVAVGGGGALGGGGAATAGGGAAGGAVVCGKTERRCARLSCCSWSTQLLTSAGVASPTGMARRLLTIVIRRSSASLKCWRLLSKAPAESCTLGAICAIPSMPGTGLPFSSVRLSRENGEN